MLSIFFLFYLERSDVNMKVKSLEFNNTLITTRGIGDSYLYLTRIIDSDINIDEKLYNKINDDISFQIYKNRLLFPNIIMKNNLIHLLYYFILSIRIYDVKHNSNHLNYIENDIRVVDYLKDSIIFNDKYIINDNYSNLQLIIDSNRERLNYYDIVKTLKDFVNNYNRLYVSKFYTDILINLRTFLQIENGEKGDFIGIHNLNKRFEYLLDDKNLIKELKNIIKYFNAIEKIKNTFPSSPSDRFIINIIKKVR